MSEHLVLTFAEIEFLLRIREPEQVAVREQLGFDAGADADRTAAAGLASLLARGLCTSTDGRVVPSVELVGLTSVFAAATTGTRALGWRDGKPVLLHLFTGPQVGVVLQPTGFGQYTVALLDAATSLADQLIRFVDACLAGTRESAVLVRSGEVRIAVATRAAGDWYISDSVASPGQGRPSTRNGAAGRIRELLAVPA